ncbi:MAG: hypothetical protein AAGK02_02315 [Pseudomonadota bacterium]
MNLPPFTVSADLNLGNRVAPYILDGSARADVRISEGEVPSELPGATDHGPAFQIEGNRFLLNVPNGASYLVENGDTIIYRRNSASDREVALFLLGSAWGALCYQRDLLPLHASGVVANGRVFAFTGPSGSGKSTLAAAMADRDLGFFTDDVLVINPDEIGRDKTICYAGQKDMKLWADALKLVDAEQGEQVRDRDGFEKFFANPAAQVADVSAQLDCIVLLKNENARTNKDPVAFERISGGKSLVSLRNSIYRQRFGLAIMGRQRMYSILAKLIATVEIHEFDRPLAKQHFEATSGAMQQWIASRASG